MRRFLRRCALSLTFAIHAWCSVTVILTRHAEIPSNGSDPSLTTQGQARAQLLAEMLRDTPIDEIFVSEKRRTQQTAQRVAEAHHLKPRQKTQAADLVAAIRERTSGTILIVGHSNTVPQVIAQLGGPSFEIAETEFDNLFIVTIMQGQSSTTRLRYGNNAIQRTSIMQISFVKSGGFAGPMTRVQGTINLKDGDPSVDGDASYHRTLAPSEAETIRAGADPAVLSKATSQLAAVQSAGKGMGDVEQYNISVKTSDGKTHNVSLNASGSTAEMQGVDPAAAKFFSFIQAEAQRILSAKMKAK
jgi:broad specificity phosphatase PhoE